MTFNEDETIRNAPHADEQREDEPEDIVDTEALFCRIKELEAESAENRNKYLRSVADLSNYRKRIERDREQQAWREKARIVSRFLEIADDFKRATDAIPETVKGDGWVEGVMLVERKLHTTLQEFNVEPFIAVGELFDPNLHSALMEGESDTYPQGVVMAELQKGYMMDGQVLRHAMVQVSSGAPNGNNQ